MAPRPEHNDNVIFLMKCIDSNGIKIDFNKVGLALGINSNAARMRFTRLRKAIVSGSDEDVQADAESTPQTLPASVRRSIKNTHSMPNRKRKYSHDQAFDASTRRGTRGIKIDYSVVHTGPDSSSDTDGEDDASDYIQASITPGSGVKTRRLRTPVPTTGVLPHTPPPSNNPVRQDFVVLETSPADQAAHHMPANGTLNREGGSNDGLCALPYDDAGVEDDFRDLEDGQRVTGATFKRRKHDFDDMKTQPSPSSLVRHTKPDSYLELRETAVRACNMDGCVLPTESASMVHDYREELREAQGQGARTWLQRIFSF